MQYPLPVQTLAQVDADWVPAPPESRSSTSATGVDVTLECWEGVFHGWHGSAHVLPEARQAIERIGEFFAEHVG